MIKYITKTRFYPIFLILFKCFAIIFYASFIYLYFSLGKVTLSICHGIVRNMTEMMPPTLIHRAGMTRIIGSGGGLCRNPILEEMVRYN